MTLRTALPQQLSTSVLTLVTSVLVMSVTATTMATLLAFLTTSTLASPLVFSADAQGTTLGTTQQTLSVFLEQRSPAVPPGHVSQYAPLPDDSEDGHNKPHERLQLVSINNTVNPSSTGEPLRNTYHRSETWDGTGTVA